MDSISSINIILIVYKIVNWYRYANCQWTGAFNDGMLYFIVVTQYTYIVTFIQIFTHGSTALKFNPSLEFFPVCCTYKYLFIYDTYQ